MTRMRKHIRIWFLAAAGTWGALAAASCGSSNSTSPSTPPAATFTITNNTVNPKNVSVPRGSQVAFVNNDGRSHNMTSDPHPEHTQCPELAWGFLTSGQQRASSNLNTARTCGFHDHNLPDNANLKGTIIIQ